MTAGRTRGTRSARGVCPRPRRAMIEEHPLPSFDRERAWNNRDESKGVSLFRAKEGDILWRRTRRPRSWRTTGVDMLVARTAHEIKLSRCDSERNAGEETTGVKRTPISRRKRMHSLLLDQCD